MNHHHLTMITDRPGLKTTFHDGELTCNREHNELMDFSYLPGSLVNSSLPIQGRLSEVDGVRCFSEGWILRIFFLMRSN